MRQTLPNEDNFRGEGARRDSLSSSQQQTAMRLLFRSPSCSNPRIPVSKRENFLSNKDWLVAVLQEALDITDGLDLDLSYSGNDNGSPTRPQDKSQNF